MDNEEKMTVSNKELIKRLSDYFVKCDPEVVAKTLAGAMVDFHRIRTVLDLPEEERECLFERLEHNDNELVKFAKNGPTSELKLSVLNSGKK